MSKEIYEEVKEWVKDPQHGSLDYGILGALPVYMRDKINKLCDFAKACDIGLMKQLKPPTADELCEELSEYYGCEVLHNTYEHDDINETFMRDAFYRIRIKKDMDDKPYKVKWDIVAGGSDGITFNAWLPPRLIKRIAQFYENEVNKDV